MIKPGGDNLRSFQYPQTVEFNGQEDQHSVELFSSNVTIIPSSGSHHHGSSKVKLKNIVDFSWEHRFYTGQLLAVHTSGKYIAYGVKVGPGGWGVRVVYKEREQRVLLKGMRDAIQDLAFAHISSALLACVDYSGSLFVYSIESTIVELRYTLVLQVTAEDSPSTSHRVIWCPYIPEDEPAEADEVSKLLVLTRGSHAELWSVANITAKFGSGPMQVTDSALTESGGMLEINQHSAPIVEATFSPDGTALATASLDGEVKFFQVYMHSNTSHGTQQQPLCLHQWRPHNGRPISSLFFLDDHKNYQPDAQFWRFAITGCDNNTELKVWSCELWTCLQTIKFQPTPSSGKAPVLKAGLDLSAGYLLLSDIYNEVLYILSVAKNSGEALAYISSISEFLLPYPILSFGIVDAGQRRIRPTGESLEDLCPGEDEAEDQLVVRMYLVQPKSLQECHIAFRPATQIASNCLMDTLTHDSLHYSEDLPELGTVNHNGNTEENGEDDRTLSAVIENATNHNVGLNLMTPDAFSSPAKKEGNALDSNPGSPDLGTVLSASPSLAQAVQALNASDPPLATSELEDQAPASGGSSPSREVREILSLAEDIPEPEGEEENKPESAIATDEGWPNIPIVLLKDVSVHAMQEAEDSPEDEDIDVQEKLPKDETKFANVATSVDPAWNVTNNQIHAVTNKLESILEIMQEQREELRELRAEVTRLRQETPVTTRVESALARVAQQQNASLEQTLHGQLTRQQEILNSLEITIKDKISSTLPRVVENAVDPLKHQLRIDVERMDDILKDNLTRLISGAHVRDTFALAAASAAKPALDVAFKEAFANIILPSLEKVFQTMFKQVQDAFTRGTRDYLQHVESVTEKQCQQRNEQQSEALAATVRQEMQNELTRGLAMIQEGTIKTVRDSIREHLNQHLTELSGARSRATTPAGLPIPAVADAAARVLSLLQKGQLNAAFQQALSASDLNLVVLVCDKTEPSRVFSYPVGSQGQGSRCILQQPVILSLVQQLSADLGHRTELKHRWLEEAILNLDPADPVTREHMGTVLLTLQSQLTTFIAANPNHRSVRRMKMLEMAARALLSQHP